MDLSNMITNQSAAWSWAMGWVDSAKLGNHAPVKILNKTAQQIKDKFCTNGLWAPGADVLYLKLCEAAEMAQSEYENAQPGIE
jgi:hypothetical protein